MMDTDYHIKLYKKYVRSKSIKPDSSLVYWIKKNIILVATVSSVFLGSIIGLAGRLFNPSEETIILVAFPGEILMRMLNMIVLPMIASSIITALAQLKAHQCGHVGTRALVYYMATTCIAASIGVSCVQFIQPGVTPDTEHVDLHEHELTPMDTVFDFFRNLIPSNLMTACFQREATVFKHIRQPRTAYKKPDPGWVFLKDDMIFIDSEVRELRRIDGMNVIGVVSFCILLGTILGTMEEDGQTMVLFFKAINDIIIDIITAIMWYSPVGILFLIIGMILKVNSMLTTGRMIGLFMFTVGIGLAIHTFLVTSAIYLVITRKNPFLFVKGMAPAFVTAIGTASSSETLPVTFRCLEQILHIDKRITAFILPFAAIVNMDGTALYESVAAIFVAQVNGIHLTVGEICTIALVASLAGMGAVGVPCSALATMLLVLASVGLPTQDLSFIICVDWLLERFTTAVNVFGDAYGAAIVETLSKKELEHGSSELQVREQVPSEA